MRAVILLLALCRITNGFSSTIYDATVIRGSSRLQIDRLYVPPLHSQGSPQNENSEDDGWRLKESEVSGLPANDKINIVPPVERDLFIPIFAVVSLLGLFGAYGYEMLRLYFRGELYLPF